ncbi:MAG TPA: hypothetical protein VK811_04905 [Candidatus Acidoferrum sp.]|jgi:hypothetical protein|nr:hypothetical protein [Candidatus Acidoferrum sp.]
MSLKAFHLIFVTSLTTLSLGFTVWAFCSGRTIFGLLGLVVAALVVFYGVYFLKKLKKISYL